MTLFFIKKKRLISLEKKQKEKEKKKKRKSKIYESKNYLASRVSCLSLMRKDKKRWKTWTILKKLVGESLLNHSVSTSLILSESPTKSVAS